MMLLAAWPCWWLNVQREYIYIYAVTVFAIHNWKIYWKWMVMYGIKLKCIFFLATLCGQCDVPAVSVLWEEENRQLCQFDPKERNVVLCPQRPYRLLGTGSPERPPPLSSWALWPKGNLSSLFLACCKNALSWCVMQMSKTTPRPASVMLKTTQTPHASRQSSF